MHVTPSAAGCDPAQQEKQGLEQHRSSSDCRVAGKAAHSPHRQVCTSQPPVVASWHTGECCGRSKGPHDFKSEHTLPARTAFPEAAKADGNHGANQLSKCCFSCLSAVNWTILAAWQQGSATAPDMGGQQPSRYLSLRGNIPPRC